MADCSVLYASIIRMAFVLFDFDGFEAGVAAAILQSVHHLISKYFKMVQHLTKRRSANRR